MSGTAIRLLFLGLIFVYIYSCLSLELDKDVEKILSELSWNTKTIFLEYITNKGHDDSPSSLIDKIYKHRRVRSADTGGRRGGNTSVPGDDELMKLKLFRLMYETVKDSDLKIRRAELVKANYENATGFDLGYVVGDVTDKLNVMQDISNTLRRLYHAWRPVEHVNAYEQVANLAIEVTHLVDMVRVMTATPAAASSHSPPPPPDKSATSDDHILSKGDSRGLRIRDDKRKLTETEQSYVAARLALARKLVEDALAQRKKRRKAAREDYARHRYQARLKTTRTMRLWSPNLDYDISGDEHR